MMKKRLLVLMLVCAAVVTPFAGYGLSGQRADENLLSVQGGKGLLSVQAKEKKTDNKTDMKSVQTFGYQLMEQYLSQENPVLSPVSAYVMLGMAGNGAKGATKKEFERMILGIPLTVRA